MRLHDFDNAMAMVIKIRQEYVASDATTLAAAIVVLADSIREAIDTHGDEIIKAGHDIASSIEMAGK